MSLCRTFVLRGPPQARLLWAFLKANWPEAAQAARPLAVTVAEHKAKRSSDQNRRLHALLRDIAEQAWVGGRQYDAETWKEHFRRRFIGTEEIDLPDGTRIERGISTTTLGVAEFTRLMDLIESHAATELGVEFGA